MSATESTSSSAAWFALSEAQRSRWFLYQLDPASQGRHNNGLALKLHGPPDVGRITDSVQRLVDRHPMLRARFRMMGDQVEQTIVAQVPAPVVVHEVMSLGAVEREVAADAVQPFDLSRAPLIRVHLYPVEPQCTVLLLVFDHLVGDGWSFWHILQELGNDLAQGPSATPAGTANFSDFVRHQQAWLQGDAARRQWEYWKTQLGDDLPVLQLPTGGPGLAPAGHQAGVVSLYLPPVLCADLLAFATRRASSLYVGLLTAYMLVLSRYTGANDLVVGSPMPGRTDAAWDKVVGDFVNPIAIRARFDESMSLAELHAVVRQQVFRGMRNQDFPLNLLVEKLGSRLPGATGVRALFQTMFIFQKARQAGELTRLWNDPAHDRELSWGGYRVGSFPVHQRGGADMDLALEVMDVGGAVRCDFNFNAVLHSQAFIERMAQQYLQALQAIVTDDQQPLTRLDLLGDAERACLQRWAEGAMLPRAQTQLVHRLFERCVQQHAQAVALEFEGTSLSYAEVNRRANQVAHWLLDHGVQPNDRVAICVERGIAMVVAVLGVLKAGGAYVPLDPAYPSQRLSYMLADSGAMALLAQPAAAARLGSAVFLPLLMVEAGESIAPTSTDDPVVHGLRPDHTACVLYTSGSTGQPKGALNRHDSLCNLAQDQGKVLGVGVGSRVLQFGSFSFDASAWEMVTALCNGATLVLTSRESVLPGDPLTTSLKQLVISHVLLPSLAAASVPEDVHFDSLCLLVGGDVFAPALAARWARRATVYNIYGPTETAVYATMYRCSPEVLPRVPLGRPIANVRIRILDAHRRLVPIGVPGEIAIGGAGVGGGYLNRPELTAERFIDDPFGTEPGARLYRTGDLGRWLPDGNLEYLGRSDFQLKLRGFRIEPGEIEARLSQCHGVDAAVVHARADAIGGQQLVAYVVMQQAIFDASALRDALAATLPEHMLPAAFVRLDALPLSQSGKLDSGALPAPEEGMRASRDYEAPQGEIEMAVAAVWMDLLGLERVGRHDRFLQLGGHSLLALQLVARLRQRLRVEVPLRDVFAHPELADFAATLMQAGATQMQPIPHADRSAPLPLSWAQQRLWFLDQLDASASAAYHMPAGLRLRGPLDQAALQAALNRIVARHEALRTSFVSVGGEPVQRIAGADIGFALTEHDLRGLDADARPAEVERISAEFFGRPFDLAQGPLIRGHLLRLGEAEHLLLIDQHHIVSDGWSIGVLAKEVSVLYGAFSRAQADPLQPLALQYADYAAWQRGWLQGEALLEQTRFWKTHLAGAPALLNLPLDRPRPAEASYRGGKVAVVLPAQAIAGLHELGRRHGVTPFMTLLAAWAVLMARLSGHADLVIGTAVANRQRAESEPLIGFFTNTLALRLDVDGALTVAGLLAQVRAAALNAYAHQDLPFDKVVEAVQPRRSRSHSPVFQSMLVLNDVPDRDNLALPGLEVELVPQRISATHYDLTLSLQARGAQVGGELEYAADLFDAATAEAFALYFQNLVVALCAGDDQVLGSLPMLTQQQQQQVVRSSSGPQLPLGPEPFMHRSFERHAALHPDAAALVSGDVQLSYAELNRRANRIAHHLLEAGVGPGQRVALCAERGPDMVAGLLGAMKAGAAYVPLEPSNPVQRLQALLDDISPTVLLTHAHLAASLSLTLPVACTLVRFELAARHPAAGNPDPGALGLAAHDAAYVIYTSGSTGAAKGVVIEHRALAASTAARDAYYEPRRAFLLTASFAFDSSVAVIFGALASGACLVIAGGERSRDPRHLADLVHRHQVDLWESVPSLYDATLAAASPGQLASLRSVIVAGESLSNAVVRRHREVAGAAAVLFNEYGPTEATVWCSVTDIRSTSMPYCNIGRPIANTQIYVVDARRQLVPTGVVGEICIGGALLARGYWRRPELTAERFVDDPFSAQPGARMYRTGDLGCWRSDGNLEFIGRIDFQVKLRGFRVELGEVEAKLLQCDGVAETVVLVREDQPGDQRLVAYLRCHAGAEVEPAALRSKLAESLPDYMLPAAFVSLSAFPLTAFGKLDRKALPAPDAGALASRPYEPPLGALEAEVAGLWCDMLNTERVGRHDDFFALGGHSLLAVQMVSRLRQSRGVEIALGELFAHPELAAFSARLAQAGATQMQPIPHADRSAPLPLSWAQQRLWFLDRLDASAGAAYHMQAGLRLRGLLDPAVLRATLDRIVARHEALRTSFVSVGDEPVQRIAGADIGFALTEHDLRGLDADARPAAVEHISAEFFGRPFDLAQGPLIRGHLLRLGEAEHLLLIDQHHIISDGWSIGVLVKEVSALYGAFSRGLADPLPPLALQYADYAAWQRAWLQGEALRTQTDYWKTRLAGAPELLELPLDRPRPARQSYTGASVNFRLCAELSRGLKQLGQRHGATLFMTLLAGWGVLMARLSGQSEVVVGTPVANRQRRETEELIGFFVNTLALRLSVQGDPSVTELLTQVKAQTLAAYAHQDLPFEQVVEAIAPRRTSSYSPLFQTMLTMNDISMDRALELPGITLTPVVLPRQSVHFDLHPTLIEAGPFIEGELAYRANLFDETTVRHWLACYEQVLTSMVADEHQRVSRLALLNAAQRQALLDLSRGPHVPYANEPLIHAVFAERAAAQPEALALVASGRCLSYRELNQRANQVAHTLTALGVVPQDRVLLCLERSVEMAVGWLAILKAGAAYVPVEPQQPAERLRQLFDDCGATVLLTHTQLMGSLPTGALRVLALDEDAFADAPRHDPVVRGLTAQGLAYVIYTSGSTGTAKGVMGTHRSALNFWQVMRDSTHHGLGPSAQVALNASFAFDMSLKGWLQLLSGHCLHLIPSAIRADGSALIGFLRAHHIDALDSTPSQLGLLLDAGLLSMPAPEAPQVLLLGGEPIAPPMWRRLQQAGPIRFFNMYGPTECTVDATIGRILPEHTTPHIGWPIPNARVYLLDEALEPVPWGMVGEIYVAGVGVARGYLNRPELTAERFVEDPFVAGERMYKTGDLGRWLAGGAIEYRGRNDFQVKLRGFRVELGEIEAALRANPQVKDALVLTRADQEGQTRLIAYLVAQHQAGLVVTDLRNQLALQLPEYMVPSVYSVVDHFPLNQNGKIDRQALPEPDSSAYVRGQYEAPEGELEVSLAVLWQELLGLAQVGRNDDFFDLGGHSLLAVQLVSRIRDAMQVEINLTDLFADSSLKNVAAVVAQARHAALSSIVPVESRVGLPLSLAQQRLWFLDALDPAAGAAYRYAIAIRIEGELDRVALGKTLGRIVARHESLRTTFVMREGQPVQVIADPDVGLAVRECDLRALADPARLLMLAAIRREEASQPFDLSAGPLIQVKLCRLGEQEWVLLLTLHHIVTDHWSNQLLVQEINTLYGAFRQGLADPLQPMTVQYADYAVWQRTRVQEALLEQQLAFWRSHLDGVPALLEMPTDRSRPNVQSYAGGSVGFKLPEDLCRQLRQLSQRHGTTLFMTLLAGWSAFLYRISGQSDIVVGTPIANRPTREVEALIGYFVNTLALRVRFDGALSVAELLGRLRQDTVACLSNQDLAFEQVVEALNPARSLAYSPIFQVMLTLHQSAPSEAFQVTGTRWSLLDSEQDASHYDLSLALTETRDGLSGLLEYASDLFDASTIDRWAGHFQCLLASMVEDDQQPVDRLKLLTAAELQQLTRGFNARVIEPPQERLIHARFEAQVAQQPQALAVVDGQRRLSYAELNRRANQLAHHLLASGIEAEERVAVCAERSVELIVAMLGILKAGAAYVPLDPALPQERQAFMLADSQARMLLTASHLQQRLPDTVPKLLLDQPDWAEPQPQHDPALAMQPERLAYVIYTSGSTGQAKGVMVRHRNVIHLTVGQPFIDFSPRHCLAYCANPAFDASTWEIWGSLLNGARLVVVSAEVLLEPARLSALLRQEEVTILQLIAGLLKRYAQSMAEAISRVEYLIFGGDQSELHTVLDIWRHTRPCKLIHAYGPTETTTFTTDYEVGQATLGERLLPIGRAIASSQLYVLDAHLQPVPLGVQGEIYIGGGGVARGYLNRPELTAECFLRDPFSQDSEARLYKTGDLGRYRPDGNLDFLGRNDAQVKLRGYRIELGEIELRLAQCTGVKQAFAMVKTDAAGDKRLVAYVTGTPAEAGELRAQLGRHLPEYMLPAAFVTLESFPLTVNGKVDRQALPEPDAAASATRVYAAPQGDVEVALAEIWQELLHVAAVGRDDHFFELGGHSLIAVQLIVRIRELLEVDLPLKDLFARPLLRQVADAITSLRLALYADKDMQALESELAQLSESQLLAILNGANQNE